MINFAKKKKYNVILFDMDGTTADSDKVIIDTFNDLYDLYKNGQRKTTEEMIYFSGPPIRVTLKKEFPELDQKFILDEFHRISESYYEKDIKPFPYMREELLKLKQEGFKLGIVTNKMHHLAVEVLKIIKLDDLMDYVIGFGDTKTSKPNPEGIFLAMYKFKEYNLKKVLYVGDNGIDFDTAKNAKVDCCLVNWGPRKIDPSIKPKFFISSFKDLRSHLYEQNI
ncbi:MAG: HAD family hydrolase [Bacilli bacterium]|nr:HAD family hydrolase [Bacilli bacterium]